MTENIIRKAVELADGWFIDGIWLCYGDAGAKIHDAEHAIDKPLPNYIKDALAAQLVRQVDATGRYHLHVSVEFTDIREDSYMRVLNRASGEDRTLNTLKAIVESEVLSDD